ncbi:transglycosylase domain-containing protein [Clostridium grantii]|uniref:Penicillin-binding protein 1A n=1 Tax=Clostridium grantii DSM 8605 TaxID=1121316 RepID=A0A1M5SMQ2_9CLOT|nr:transglycosylase domain-containing protein [Clostridium grantii]SHH39213.1 Penicillin binding protein transpeptidase domain-containing protein [Clostridium grantii DSM 8605]
MSQKNEIKQKDDTNKKPKKKRFMAFKLILLSIFISFLFGCVVFAGIAIAMIRSAPPLDMAQIINYDESSKLYDDEGQYMVTYITEKDRTVVDISEMSKYVQNAVVSIEDERFYDHGGIDPKRILGALYNDVKSYLTGSSGLEGASTITQQLLVNTILERGDNMADKIQRKFQEIYLAIELNNEIPKDEILEAYMNTFYLGGRAIGVEAAANQYFNKPAKDLNLLESSFTAGLTQSPSVYYPYSLTSRKGSYPISNDEESQPRYITRTLLVLGSMKKNEYITETEYNETVDLVKKSPITANLYSMYQQGIIEKEFYTTGVEENGLTSESISENLLSLYDLGYISKEYYLTNAKKLYKSEAIEYLNKLLIDAQTENDEAAIKRITNSIEKLKEEDSYIAELNGGDFLENETKGEFNLLVLNLSVNSALGNEIILNNSSNSGKYAYEWFARPVISQVLTDLMEKYNYDIDEAKNMLSSGNLKIYTTMDRNLQEETQKILNDDSNFKNVNVNPTRDSSGLLQPQGSAVIVDYHTGEVKTIVGAKYEETAAGLNLAVDATYPSGSSIKPLTIYSAAIDSKILTAASVIEDSPLDEATFKKFNNWSPSNSPDIFQGYVTVQQALKNSINVVAAKIIDKIGFSTAVSYGEKFGLSFTNAEKNYPSALALGELVHGTNTFEMANAYGVFGNDGKYTEPRLYTKVVNRQGKIILESEVSTREVLSPQTAFIMSELLKGPTSSGGTGSRIRSSFTSNLPIMGKTGTSTEMKNLWFCGLTPYYSGAVWIDNHIKLKGLGSSDAAYIFGKIMMVANEGKDYAEIKMPSGLTTALIDIDSGLLPTELSYKDQRGSRVQRFYFLPGTVPTETDNVHVEAEINSSNGLLATEFTPEELREARVFITRDYLPSVTLQDQKYVLPIQLDDTLPPVEEEIPEELPVPSETEGGANNPGNNPTTQTPVQTPAQTPKPNTNTTPNTTTIPNTTTN